MLTDDEETIRHSSLVLTSAQVSGTFEGGWSSA
jgi:hypothetical protein